MDLQYVTLYRGIIREAVMVSHISMVWFNYVFNTETVSTYSENCSKNSWECHQPAWRVEKQKCERRRGYPGPLGGKRERGSPCSDEEIRVFAAAKTASAFTLIRGWRGQQVSCHNATARSTWQMV